MNAPNAVADRGAASTHDERSLAELTKQLTDQASALAQKEVELAKAEVAMKGKRLGIGAGAFGGAGVIAFYAFGALTAAIVLGLAEGVAGWLAALIVAAVYGAVAGVLALTGKKQVEQGTPPVPEAAIESTQEDLRHTKQRAKEVGQ